MSDRSATSSAALSPLPNTLTLPSDSPLHPRRPPFLHPSVSRLRSFVPQHRSRVPSSSTLQTSRSFAMSPSPSHFSAISRASSVSVPFDLINGQKTPDVVARSPTPQPSEYSGAEPHPEAPREVFRWTTLRTVSAQVYSSFKAAAVLDTHMGRPTVMVTGGLVCVGTDTGRTYIFDFRQEFRFICGPNVDSKHAYFQIVASMPILMYSGSRVGHGSLHVAGSHLSGCRSCIRTHFPVRPVQTALSCAYRASGQLRASGSVTERRSSSGVQDHPSWVRRCSAYGDSFRRRRWTCILSQPWQSVIRRFHRHHQDIGALS